MHIEWRIFGEIWRYFFRKSAYIRISHDRKSRRFYGNNVFKYTLIIAFLTYMRFTVYRSSRASGAQDTSTLTRCGQVDTLQLLCFTARSYASAVLAMALCPCLCLSVRHKSVFYRNGWANRAVFGTGASFHPSYTVLKGNSVISENKGTLWNFVLNSGLKKFRQGISIVETCYQLSSRKVDAHSVMN